MEAGINNVMYMELLSGPKMANGTCRKTIVAGTIVRGFTVVYEEMCVLMEKFYHIVSYVFLLLCLCILIAMYVLFCIFCFHRANWHFSATLTEVFLCFFLSCKANARVLLAKTGHSPHSSQISCVVLCIVCV
jgi:hypothetical protein